MLHLVPFVLALKVISRSCRLTQASHPVTGRWTDIATDIVSGFLRLFMKTLQLMHHYSGYFTNRVHLYPISSSFSAEDFVTLFMTRYFPNHGLPQSITSTVDPSLEVIFSIGVQKVLTCVPVSQ